MLPVTSSLSPSPWDDAVTLERDHEKEWWQLPPPYLFLLKLHSKRSCWTPSRHLLGASCVQCLKCALSSACLTTCGVANSWRFIAVLTGHLRSPPSVNAIKFLTWISSYTLPRQAAKENLEKLDFIEIEDLYASKDIVKEVRRQPTDWEIRFVNHISDKGLVSRLCEKKKQKTYSSTKRQINKLKNGQRVWIDISPKERYANGQ